VLIDSQLYLHVSVTVDMAEPEKTIKTDFMVKRSLMKGRIFKKEDYKSRWFVLTMHYLHYCDGSLEVCTLSVLIISALTALLLHSDFSVLHFEMSFFDFQLHPE